MTKENQIWLNLRTAFALTVSGLLGFPLASQANIVGNDAQNFVPTTSGLDFVTVHSSSTLKPGMLNFGAFMNYAYNSLPIYGGQDSKYGDKLISTDLNFGMGLLPNWDFGISLPSVLYQSLTDRSGAGISFSSTGLTEIRVNTKYRLLGDDRGGLAAVASTNIGLITNDPFTGNGASPGLNLELAADHTFGDFRMAANAGYRLRIAGTPIAGIPLTPYGNQLIASLAANYLIESWDSKIIVEVFGALPTQSVSNLVDNQQTSCEGLIGLKHDFSQSLAGHVGVGRELVPGLASPQFRAYAGLNWNIGPLWDNKPALEVSAQPDMAEPLPPPQPEVAVAVAEPAMEEAPAPVVVPETAPTLIKEGDHFVTRSLHFKFNTAELEEDYKPVLDPLVEKLKEAPYKRMIIEGHTDSVGGVKYNKRLSNLRAQEIRHILITKYGIKASKLTAIGYGKSRPIADNGNYQGRWTNRRVEFKIVRENAGSGSSSPKTFDFTKEPAPQKP